MTAIAISDDRLKLLCYLLLQKKKKKGYSDEFEKAVQGQHWAEWAPEVLIQMSGVRPKPPKGFALYIA